MRIIAITLIALLFFACSQDRPANSPPSQAEANLKAEIGKAVTEFCAKDQPRQTIRGMSFQRYSDSIYLVGVTFEGEAVDEPATNMVVRRFDEANGQIVWKAEPVSSRWRSVLRLEPE